MAQGMWGGLSLQTLVVRYVTKSFFNIVERKFEKYQIRPSYLINVELSNRNPQIWSPVEIIR